jgi:uncharacterized protein
MKKLDPGVVAAVRDEVADKGPCTAEALTDHGKTEAMDWAGWKGTPSRTKLALEVLWTRCEVVVSGRDARGRHLYDTPRRALGAWADAEPVGEFGEEMLLARVRTAGLLSRAGGPMWSMLADVRTDGTVERLLEAGRLVEARVGRRPYLMVPDPPRPRPDDGALRVLGPLDSLLWDRALVKEAFGFDYVWEIYKPAEARTWGYYVCPLLHRGALVGRMEGRRDGRALLVETLWGTPDRDSFDVAMVKLAEANGCESVAGPVRIEP